MTRNNFSLKLTTAGSLVALLLLSLPASASAYGYYHYVAADIKYHNVWPSAEPIKRMYWHHTAGGWGASIQFDVNGKQFDWVWFPLTDLGSGVFVGHATKNGCDLYIFMSRFNNLSFTDPVEWIEDPGAWSRYAWIHIEAHSEGNLIGTESGGLYFRDKSWDPE